MPSRISHSLLDPYLSPHIPRLHRALRIPRRFPPEGIIAVGHILAIAGAVGFALAPRHWWGGLLGACGVAGNHLADMVDGTHARATGQCRNGGELLDHFTDPLSFSWWMIGLAVAAGRLDLGIATVICIYATAVLTNIRAKLLGAFTLARFGPTEFKALLVLFGLAVSAAHLAEAPRIGATTEYFLWALVAIGVAQLLVNLIKSVREVNRAGAAPDTAEWKLRNAESARAPAPNAPDH